jgi:hypothetical protein
MVAFVDMTPLQQTQALYVDAYHDAWGCEPERLPTAKWEDIRYLEASIEGLIDIALDRKYMEQSEV